MDSTLHDILRIAVQAPSGENSQPWEFEIKDNQISVLNNPKTDQSPYNYGQRASYFAHGALLVNIQIVSSTMGYTTSISLFPDKEKQPNLVATVLLNKGIKTESPLYKVIPKRSTNRRPYDTKPFEISELQSMELSLEQVHYSNKPKDIYTLAKAASTAERLIFGHKLLHSFFFNHINWTEEEEVTKKRGLYIKTFELAAPQEQIFRLLRNWPLANILNKIGMSKRIAAENAKVYAQASAVGIIHSNGIEPEDFIEAGQIAQRLWLTFTSKGIALQPLSGILFLKNTMGFSEKPVFTPKQQSQINSAYRDIRSTFKFTKVQCPIFMFRIGRAPQPTAHSLKSIPIIV